MNEVIGGKSLIRAFIAIPAGAALRERLADAQEHMKHSGSDVRWVEPRNIHLTLVFLGDIFTSAIEPIAAALDALSPPNPRCVLEARGLGFFGRPSSPRVIWAGLRGDLAKVTTIQQQAFAAARDAGCRPDEKPFRAHLTIGRARSARNARALLKAIESQKDACFGEFPVQNVVLFQSRLGPAGPEYSPLHESVLASGKDREKIATAQTSQI